jgi:hypothetical protein
VVCTMIAASAELIAGPEWPIRSDLNGRLIGGHPVSLVVLLLGRRVPEFSITSSNELAIQYPNTDF